MSTPRWIVVAGPTASGKSELALELAERFGGEIVNADSRQVYRYMDVGTAKPTPAERARAPHHLYDVVVPSESFDAALYAARARPAVAEVAARGRVPIAVGGTGLYLRALARGLFAGPQASAPLRRALASSEAARPGALHRWLRRLDPGAAERIHANDAVRLVRALEVTLLTGSPISRFQRMHGFEERLGEALWIVVDPGRAELARRIEERARRMFASGLVEEVRGLWARGFGPDLLPLRSIGYVEAGRVLRGERDVETAVADLVRSTRRFAKRQLTWFRGEPEARWFDPDRQRESIVEAARRFLAR